MGKRRSSTEHDPNYSDWEGRDVIVHSPLRPLIDDKDGYLVLGRSESSHRKWRRKATLDLGEVGEHQDTGDDLSSRRVYIDAAFPHIIFICGKRGSGKSYTLGILAEELARSAIGVGVVLIDPIGIFWSLKKENESAREREELVRWGLSPHSFPEVRVLVPGNPESLALGAADGPFTIGVSEMTAEDWCQVFDMDRFKTQGLLIGAAIDQVRMGYTAIGESGSFRVSAKGERFSLGDMINCIKSSDNLTSKEGGYTPQTRRSLIARFSAAGGWGIFSVDGTPLSDVSSPNRVTVIDVSDPELGDDKRSLITGIVARKILSARTYSARMEEAGGVESIDPERIPVTWLMLDEAHVILPHGRQTPATDALIEYAKQGRRPGCALVLATQRPASTSDEILSQVDILIGHNLALEDDMTALRRRVPAKLPPEFANSDFIRAIPVGTAIVADQRTQQRSFLIRLRPRMSHHAGSSAMPSALVEKRKERVQVPISATQSSFHNRADVMRPTDGSRTVKDGPLSPAKHIDQGRYDGQTGLPNTVVQSPNNPKVDPLSQLKDGNTSMMISSDAKGLSDRAAEVWKDRKFIVVSRTHPTVYPGIEGLRPEKVLWLSSTPSEISISPNAIQDLLVDIGRSLDSPGKKAVLLDGLEPLLTENDRRSVMRFFKALRERVFLGGHMMVIRVDPSMGFGSYEPISREMDVVLRDEQALNSQESEMEKAHGPQTSADIVGEAPGTEPILASVIPGSLAKEDLVNMCRLMGLSEEGSDQDLLSRLVSLQEVDRSSLVVNAGETVTRIGEMARMMRENSDLRDRIQSLEHDIRKVGDIGGSSEKGIDDTDAISNEGEKAKTKGRSSSRKMRVIWDTEASSSEIKSLKAGMDRMASELSELKERLSSFGTEGPLNDPDRGDELIERFIKELEKRQADELERLEQLELSLKGVLSSIGSDMRRGDRTGSEDGPLFPMGSISTSRGERATAPISQGDRKGPLRKLKVEKTGAEVPMIAARITSEEAASLVKKTLKRSFFKGPVETVTSVEPVFLPLIRCLVNYRSGIMNNLKNGDVYFDPVCGELVLSTSGGIRRTRGLPFLLTISQIERKTFDHLGMRGEEDAVIADASGMTKAQAKRALGSLVKKGIAKTITGEGNVLLYARTPRFSMDEKPWKKDPEWHPKMAPSPEERILPGRSDERLPELCLDLIGGKVRLMNKDSVLYPYYTVKVTGEGRTRHCFVDAVWGKIDPDLTEISKDIL